MPISEKEMFQRLEIALKVYYDEFKLDQGSQIQLDLFINWLYNQYGLVRKGVGNEKQLDTVPKVGS